MVIPQPVEGKFSAFHIPETSATESCFDQQNSANNDPVAAQSADMHRFNSIL
jgi:hypothetical protein